jgi:hypothetical protein
MAKWLHINYQFTILNTSTIHFNTIPDFSRLDNWTLNQNELTKMESLQYGVRVFNTLLQKSSYVTVVSW